MRKLSQAPLRTLVRIGAVESDPSYRRRLLELGFLPGTEVQVLGAAPMGDPLLLEVRGCSFSIRRAEAEAISVIAVEPRSAAALSGALAPTP